MLWGAVKPERRTPADSKHVDHSHGLKYQDSGWQETEAGEYPFVAGRLGRDQGLMCHSSSAVQSGIHTRGQV